MKQRRNSVIRLMAIVLVAALDFALLRNNYFNRPYILAILGLEYGLFRMASRPEERAYWVAFELLGWAYAVVDFYFFSQIRYGILGFCQQPFMEPIIRSLLFVTRIADPNFFSLLALGFEYAMTFFLAIAGGRLADRWFGRRQVIPES
jgi:hypothetical protein